MIARISLLLIAVAACDAPRQQGSSAPAPTVTPQTAAAPAAVDAPAAAPSPPVAAAVTVDAAAAPSWTIAAGQVGPIALGKPLPAELIDDALADRYVARYIADAQPVDGFRFDAPGLTAFVEGGPFAKLSKRGFEGPPPTAELRVPGATAARAGAKVTMVMIDGPGAVTAAGLGVGATLVALKAAYPDLRTYPRPPTEERTRPDGCVARAKSMPGVGFVFSTCRAADAGELVGRVDLWIPES